ncbi:MAG: PDZ domain-containing protein [Spirosomataceae bacterium]
MFEHIRRRTKKTLHSYYGIDWNSYKPDYLAHLPHIGNNYEFAGTTEMLGELNVSHSGASYVGGTIGGDATASLGVFYDWSYNGPGVREEVIKDGPADKAGLNIKAGSIIEAIDGEAITPDRDIAQYLNRSRQKRIAHAARRHYSSRGGCQTYQHERRKPVALQTLVRRNQDEVENPAVELLGYIHIFQAVWSMGLSGYI